MATSFRVHNRITTVDKDGKEVVLEEGGLFSTDEIPMSPVAIEHLVTQGDLEPVSGVNTKAARAVTSKE